MTDSKDTRILCEELIDFCNGVEAQLFKLRTQIEKLIGASKPKTETKPQASADLPFDVSKIKWQDRENERGKFQISEDLNSLDHKNLLKFLAEHTSGKCVNSKDSEGRTWFIWTFPNGSTIGRKLRKEARC